MGGEIVEYGSHDDLYQGNGLYRELFDCRHDFINKERLLRKHVPSRSIWRCSTVQMAASQEIGMAAVIWQCDGHSIVLASESPATGSYR